MWICALLCHGGVGQGVTYTSQGVICQKESGV